MLKKRSMFAAVLVMICLFMVSGIPISTMAASAKPSRPKLISVQQTGAKEVTVRWKRAKNAKKYELFVSVNKGPFKKLKTLKKLSYTHTGLKQGATYKYKVRAVNGKSKSAFSKTKTAKIKKGYSPSGPVLSVNVQSITIKQNQTGEAVVTFTHDGNVFFDIENENIVECEWQDGWYGGGNLTKLYITGKKPGSTIITISNDYNSETCRFTVNVIGKTTADYYEDLKAIIMKSGQYTKAGDPIISFDTKTSSGYEVECNISYVKSSGSFRFFMSYNREKSGKSDFYIEMNVNANALSSDSVNPVFTYFPQKGTSWLEARTTLYLSRHTKNSVYVWRWTDGEGSFSDFQDFANDALRIAFDGWRIVLEKNTNITLRDLGFSSYS